MASERTTEVCAGRRTSSGVRHRHPGEFKRSVPIQGAPRPPVSRQLQSPWARRCWNPAMETSAGDSRVSQHVRPRRLLAGPAYFTRRIGTMSPGSPAGELQRRGIAPASSYSKSGFLKFLRRAPERTDFAEAVPPSEQVECPVPAPAANARQPAGDGDADRATGWKFASTSRARCLGRRRALPTRHQTEPPGAAFLHCGAWYQTPAMIAPG